MCCLVAGLPGGIATAAPAPQFGVFTTGAAVKPLEQRPKLHHAPQMVKPTCTVCMCMYPGPVLRGRGSCIHPCGLIQSAFAVPSRNPTQVSSGDAAREHGRYAAKSSTAPLVACTPCLPACR